MNRHVARAALVASCCLAPLAAAAQSAPADPNAVEEIVVMARKQGERLLDAPATITVIEQQKLEAANITNANQLTGIVPGLITMQGTAGTSAAFRGVGSTSADPGMESSVATFVDGVYLGHPRDFILPMYDIAQIELVKGTQSTLLGKNTSLGAIAITSRRPGSVVGYDLAYTYSDGIEGHRIQGGVDIPLEGGFAMRLAGIYNDEQGFVRNDYLNETGRQVQEASGRITLAGPISDFGDVTLIYQHDDRDGKGHNFEILSDPIGVVRARALALGQTNFEAIGNDRAYSGYDAVGPGAIPGGPQYDKQRGDRAVGILTFDLNDYVVTAQTSWVQWRSSRSTDLDFTRARLLEFSDREKNGIFSQEVRISSLQDGPFSWLAGIYYYDNRWTLQRSTFGQSGGGLFPLAGFSESAITIFTTAWSGFASANYKLSDQFTVTGGLRYTNEEKTATYSRRSGGVFASPTIAPAIPVTTLPSSTSKDLDGDIGLQFRPQDRTLIYLTWSKGSKSGGYQNGPLTLAVAPYDGETAYTTELGAKFDFPGRGFVTAALFDTRVKDFQVSRAQVVNGLVQTTISNGDIGTRGAEVAGSWRVSDDLTLNGNVVYAPAKFRKDFPEGVTPLVAYEGMPLPRAPEWTAEIGARYVRAVTDALDLRLEGKVGYASDSDLQFRSTDPLAPVSKAHTFVDAQVALANGQSGWEVALIGTNLTDERYVTFTTGASASPDAYYGTLSRPRVIALQLKLSR
jgi:outer membrane receptor protein involved in Fe transport